LDYDSKLKGYRPTANFKPRLTKGLSEEYLHALASNRDFSHTFTHHK